MQERNVTLPAGYVYRVHVDQHRIRDNIARAENGEDLIPPVTVQTSKDIYKGMTVKINGPSEVVYRPAKPLGCGARLWMETRAEIEIEV